MRHSASLKNLAAFYEFADPSFLNSKRPAIPGGAWPVECLRNKSLADLQQIWVSLMKARNMLSSTKEHYVRHQEELGAMPAPSRLKMVETSMRHLRQVVRERDFEAVTQAAAIFQERLQRGVYRYPPGPPPPPGAHDKTMVVRISLSKRVDPDRLKEVFARYDVFEAHRGIVRIDLRLPEAVLKQKQEAEQLWQQYMTERSDTAEYMKWAAQGPSIYDAADVEMAPGVWTRSRGDEGSEGSPMVSAATLPVPPPLTAPPPPRRPLERIKHQQRSVLSKAVIQLSYFPNITREAPRYKTADEVPRPVHPDEIEGPWEALVTYDSRDGLEYATALGVKRIDGADVLDVAAEPMSPQPYAAVDPVYQEAVRQERASEETMMKWPHVPTWKYEYALYTKKHVHEIVQYNYSNVVDYVDREVLLTGRSVWECPIDIDPTCGGMKSVPVHAKPPVRHMNPGLGEIGLTDI